MRFPDTLTVLVRDEGAGLPAKDVAVVLVLFAAHKNDYSVGPLISDENGHVEFTRAECEFAIKRAQEMFLMDYSGNLGSCRPVIEVRLHPQERVEGMRQQYESAPEFWGRGFHDPKRLFADLQKVRNAEYKEAQITATEEQLLTNPHLVLPLTRKAA